MKKYSIQIMLFVFIFVQLILLTENLWYDELMTTPLILGYDVFEIIKQLRFDVHPPLYFILLKIYSFATGDSILALKTFNILIALILILIMYQFSKKTINKDYALLVVFIFCFYPVIYNEIYQIRMYVIAQLFVTLTAIYAYKTYFNQLKRLNIILFLAFTICSLYTHYYALIGVVFIHLVLYFALFFKNKQNIKIIIALVFISLISFLPWLPTFFKQLVVKSQHLGYIPTTKEMIIKAIMYPFYTGSYAEKGDKLNYVLTLLLLIVFVLIIFSYFHTKKHQLKENRFTTIMSIALGIPFLIPIIFVTVSIISKPIWYSRYFIISYPLFVFAFAYMAYNLTPRLKYLFIAIVFMASIQKIYSIHQITSDKGMENFSNLIDNKINENDIILDANYYTSTYFSQIKQYNLKENEATNWDRHIYWNVTLTTGYESVLRNRDTFWSMQLTKDSILKIGTDNYKVKESYSFNYMYFSKGVISIYKYSKIPNEQIR